MVSLERSEKVMHEYVIFIYVYACFLCLNLKLVTLPEKQDTIWALIKLYRDTISLCNLGAIEIVSRYT